MSKARSARPCILVSACLLGVESNYKGGRCHLPQGDERDITGEYTVIPICPEQLGGMSTPRTPSEICGGSGEDVLDGCAGVFSRDGHDVTECFLKGAREAVRIASLTGADMALLQTASPSCGCLEIHDGKFAGARKPGRGVAAAALHRAGIKIIDASQWAEFRKNSGTVNQEEGANAQDPCNR